MSESAYKIQPGSVCRAPYEAGGFGGKLVSDWAKGAPSAMQFFPPRTWQEAAQEIATRKYPRYSLPGLLEPFNKAEPALRNAKLLAEENTYAIVTGQQAGFLGGPLYTLHKALTAIKLARQYEREAGGAKKFVPVFWVAGDDHDIAEIDHANFLGSDGNVLRVDAPILDECRGCSARDVLLNDEPARLQRLLEELAPFLPAEYLERLFKSEISDGPVTYSVGVYRNHSFENAFVCLLSEWLGPEGLVVVPSSWLRGFSKELLLENLDDFEIDAEGIRAAGEAMKDAGYEPGFSDKLRVAPHFFRADLSANPPGNIRAPIHVGERDGVRKFIVNGPREIAFTREELGEEIKKHTHWFSTSAALRPVLQQLIFPCVAVVLGPGEMAYWAQLREVHQFYDAVWPVIVPRATLTLLDGAGEKAVRKLGLADAPAEIFKSKEELTRRALAGTEVPASIAAHKDAMLGEFDAMRAEILSLGAGVDSMLDKVRSKINYQLGRVLDRTARAIDQRGEAKAARAAYLAGLVRPKNSPQERVLCAAQFMAKYPDLPRRLLEVIDPDAREHLIVTL